MLLRKLLFVSVPIMLMFSSAGCTRSSTTPQVVIDLNNIQGKNSAFNDYQLNFAVLQVSRAGQVTRYMRQSCRDPQQVRCGEFVLPNMVTGPAKFQVFAVYEKNGTGHIFYAAPDADLQSSGGPVRVDISLEEIGYTQASFVGKYVPESGELAEKLLTGKIDTYVSSGNDPEMLVSRSGIFAGMFSDHLIKEVNDLGNWKYYFSGYDESGAQYESVEVLQDVDPNGLSVDSAQLRHSGDHMIRVDIPDRFEKKTASSTTTNFQPSYQLYVGSIGYERSNRPMCWDDLAFVEYDGSNDHDVWCDRSDCSGSNISWPSAGGGAAFEVQFVEDSSIQDCSSLLGADVDNNNKAFDENLHLFRNNLNMFRNGEGVAGFFGPFRSYHNGSSWKFLHGTSAPPTIEMQLHDGLPSGSSVAVMVSADSINPSNFMDIEYDHFSCEKIANSGLFNQATVNTVAGNDRRFLADISSLTAAGAVSQNSWYALCGIAPDGRYYPNGILFSNGSSGQQQQPAQLLEMKIFANDGNTELWNSTNPQPFQFDPVGSNTNYYFLVIKNATTLPLSLDNSAAFHYSYNSQVTVSATMGFDHTTASAVGSIVGTNRCDTADLGAANDLPSGASCYMRISFGGGGPTTIPHSYADYFNVKLDQPSEMEGFPTLGFIYSEAVDLAPTTAFNDVNPTGNVDWTFDAPPGRRDAKYVKLEASAQTMDFDDIRIMNNNGRFNLISPPNGMYDCRSVEAADPSLAITEHCYIGIEYLAPNDGSDTSVGTPPFLEIVGFHVGAGGPSNFIIDLRGSSLIEASGSPAIGYNPLSTNYEYNFGPVPNDASLDVTLIKRVPNGSSFMDAVRVGPPLAALTGDFDFFATEAERNTPTNAGNDPTCLASLISDPCQIWIRASNSGSAKKTYWFYYEVNGSFQPFNLILRKD